MWQSISEPAKLHKIHQADQAVCGICQDLVVEGEGSGFKQKTFIAETEQPASLLGSCAGGGANLVRRSMGYTAKTSSYDWDFTSCAHYAHSGGMVARGDNSMGKTSQLYGS